MGPSATGADMLACWMQAQKLKAPTLKNASVFDRNLEEALDIRRHGHGMFTIKPNLWKEGNVVDFGSNDGLSLGVSGLLWTEFEKELHQQPVGLLGTCSSRVMDGNYRYLEQVEAEIARFHGAETALMVGSGTEANIALFTAIPRPGDVIVYDELVHASAHDGMQLSQATASLPFAHNDVDAFREVMVSILDSHPLIRQGKRCVLVAVESFYSMEGDICPLAELIRVAKEYFPDGNAQFMIDEAHSTGLVGPSGAGLVSELGLEREVAMRLHTFSKSLASTGAVILGNQILKNTLLNLSRSVIFSSPPSLPTVASVRAGYNLMATGRTQAGQQQVQHLVRYFLQKIVSNALWEDAEDRDILFVPLSNENWEEKSFFSPVVPIRTRERYSYWLFFHLQLANFCIFPFEHPVVPRGKSRIRVIFHAHNTEAEVDALMDSIDTWIREIIELEENGMGDAQVPKAARQAYSLMAKEVTNGIEAH